VPVEVALADLDALFPDHRDEIVEWARYPLGVAWALRDAARAASRDADALTGVDIALASDVPVGAGLSSSAAIEGATASALNDVWQLSLSPVDLAQAGRRAENLAVGAPTGIMGPMLGRADAGIFLDCRSMSAAGSRGRCRHRPRSADATGRARHGTR
jgi:galactokinase